MNDTADQIQPLQGFDWRHWVERWDRMQARYLVRRQGRSERIVKQVYLAENPIEAHMVVDLLQAQGIAAAVQGEHLFAIRGAVPINYPTVWVLDEDDYDRARELALEYDRGQYGKGIVREPWACAQCGEQIEGHFDQCWHCGAERPTEESAS